MAEVQLDSASLTTLNTVCKTSSAVLYMIYLFACTIPHTGSTDQSGYEWQPSAFAGCASALQAPAAPGLCVTGWSAASCHAEG